ncbi:MAG: tRNA 2-selenouridine(34) synthase MnmH [Candidatus Kapaibacteriota bacterium]
MQMLLVDVRSPAEYEQGHIPGAISVPLLSNDERAVVGTAYKQQSRQAAIDAALRYVAPRMEQIVASVQAFADGRPVQVYCWRGGMRSASVTWLLRDAGIASEQMPGGYKAYRRDVLTLLEQPWKMIVVGGRTGSGKTQVLQALRARGQQVLDLEALAHHKGSSFGALQQPPQPSSEHMANLMATELSTMDPQRTLFVEDESLRIGTVVLHKPWYDAMQNAPVVVLDVERSERASFLADDYGDAVLPDLIAAFQRIERRIGGLRLQRALTAINLGNLADAATQALEYYDATYDYAIERRAPHQLHRIEATGLTIDQRAAAIEQAIVASRWDRYAE